MVSEGDTVQTGGEGVYDINVKRLRLYVSASRPSPVFMCFALIACIYVLCTLGVYLCASHLLHVFTCFALVACICVLCTRRMYLCALPSSCVSICFVARVQCPTGGMEQVQRRACASHMHEAVCTSRQPSRRIPNERLHKAR